MARIDTELNLDETAQPGPSSSGWDLLLKWFEEEAQNERDDAISQVDNPLESDKE